MAKQDTYKTILTFNLKEGQANEELKRSIEDSSFPNMLAGQPGFISLELVRVNESKTLSVQTWDTEKDWWNALEAVKLAQSEMTDSPTRPSILESRDFVGGHIVRSIAPMPSDKS